MKINSINNFVIPPIHSVKPSSLTRQIPDFTDYTYKIEQNAKNDIYADGNIKNRHMPCTNHVDISSNPLEYTAPKSLYEYNHRNICIEKLYEPLILSCNLKRSILNFQDQQQSSKSASKKELISLKDLSSTANSYKKLTLEKAEENLNEIRNSILNFSSPSAILNASYLLSASIVFHLLNRETIEYSDSSDDY